MKDSEVLNIKNQTIYSENCKTAWNRNRQCREAGGRGGGGEEVDGFTEFQLWGCYLNR